MTNADRLDAYDFDLPPERIAQRPLDRRDASRLMALVGDAPPRHASFRDFPTFLRAGDVLVRNDTRVLPARLRGRRGHGGKSEVLLVHPLPEIEDRARWVCLARPAGPLKPGRTVSFGGGELKATVEENHGAGKVTVRFDRGGEAFRDALLRLGETPLPPYIERGDSGPDGDDRDRYQTIYARKEGAVAAPTAGLHFTPDIDAALAARGIQTAHLTLHVGPGTFRPIKADSLDDHQMDAEFYEISEATAELLNKARAESRRLIAIGTTSTRALESAVREDGTFCACSGWTDLFIRPGYRFRAISGLLTNFHLPRSSLLVLVSALAGRERVLDAYAEAVREEYRFYSYGDAMLILPAV